MHKFYLIAFFISAVVMVSCGAAGVQKGLNGSI